MSSSQEEQVQQKMEGENLPLQQNNADEQSSTPQIPTQKTKAERFRNRFTALLQKHNMEHLQEAQNLLRDTVAWLNATTHPLPPPESLYVHALLPPHIATLLQKLSDLADPTATREFRTLLADMATLRDDNLTLTEKVEELETEVKILRMLFFFFSVSDHIQVFTNNFSISGTKIDEKDQKANESDAKLLLYDVARVYIHYYIGGGRRKSKHMSDQETKESVADKNMVLDWESITDQLSCIKMREEDGDITAAMANRERERERERSYVKLVTTLPSTYCGRSLLRATR